MHYSERESRLLAPYAVHAAESAGRGVPEPDHPYRSPFQRDRDRITHSAAFRRLSQKTQVITGELLGAASEDYHRTRLTHTLEVASIARTVARGLRLNEDLVEALALAHDVGHPPFGHAGEDVLDAFLVDEGGFNHNRQALRIFERLETRYPDRPGLNLTQEVLEGQRSRGPDEQRPPHAPHLEAQVVDATDAIAYGAHDADDALVTGLIDLGVLAEATLWRDAVASVQARYTALTGDDLRRAAVHALIERLVSDLLDNAAAEIARLGVDSPNAAREAGVIVRGSAESRELSAELQALLFERVYRHPVVVRHRSDATAALGETLRWWESHAERLPRSLREIASQESPRRAVADHVSSLTDRAVLADISSSGRD